jgi:hypothetical protein
MLAHKFLQLALKLFRRGRPIENSCLHIGFNLIEDGQSAIHGKGALRAGICNSLKFGRCFGTIQAKAESF